MKKILALAIIAVCLSAVSCGRLESEIHAVDMRTDEVEQDAIATITQQIESVSATIQELKKAKDATQSSISSINEEIKRLQVYDGIYDEKIAELYSRLADASEADTLIDGLISDLQDHLEELKKDEQLFENRIRDDIESSRIWMEATFVSLNELEEANEVLAYIKAVTDDFGSVIGKALDDADAQLRKTVSTLLADYLTYGDFQDSCAVIKRAENKMQHGLDSLSKVYEALLSTIEATDKAIASGAADVRKELSDKQKEVQEELNRNKQDIDDLEAALNAHKENLAKTNADLLQLKTDILTECTSAANTAISEFKGVITQEIRDGIDSLQNAKQPKFKALADSLSSLTSSTESIENKVSDIKTALEAINKSINDICSRLTAMEGKIQSLTFIPGENDNPRILEWEAERTGLKGDDPVFNFMVSPAAMADTVAKYKDFLKVLGKTSQRTKADVFDSPLTVMDVTVRDKANGVISVTVGTEEQLVSALDKGDLSLCICYNDGTSNNISSDFASIGTETPKRTITVKEVQEGGTLNLILPWDHTPAQYSIHPSADPAASASLFTYLSAHPDIASIENATGLFQDLDDDELEELDESILAKYLSTPEGLITAHAPGTTPMYVKVAPYGTSYKASTFEFYVNVIESKLRFYPALTDMNPRSSQNVILQINDNGTWRNVQPSDNVSISYKIRSYGDILSAILARILANLPFLENDLTQDITETMASDYNTSFDASSMKIQYGSAYRPGLFLTLDSQLTITATKQMDGYTDTANVTITLNAGGLF